jgi:Permeases of the drug/metabolite transporter (DMT) superfamily
MQVASAYLLVVLIWSTTPLAIHWSNSSLSFISAITVRMVLATLLCFGLLKICRQPLIVQRRDWLVYAASALGLFPNMLLIYWAAQTIPSGLMSVIMGIYPFCVGIFSIFVLQENPFTRSRILALLLAVFGLWLVQREQSAADGDALWGIIVMVLVCVIWGFSSVTVKKLGAGIAPLRMGTGSLLVSTPFFLLAWFGLDRELPELIDQKSLVGVVYLVLAGSIIGHILWFYVLRVCSVASVSLITLITPVMALTWGHLAGEQFSAFTLVGAGVIVLALALYQGFFFRLWRESGKLANAVAPEFTTAALARRRRSD